MNKVFLRFTAFLLVPGLVFDPGTASALASSPAGHRALSYPVEFGRQALSPVLGSGLQDLEHPPHATVVFRRSVRDYDITLWNKKEITFDDKPLLMILERWSADYIRVLYTIPAKDLSLDTIQEYSANPFSSQELKRLKELDGMIRERMTGSTEQPMYWQHYEEMLNVLRLMLDEKPLQKINLSQTTYSSSTVPRSEAHSESIHRLPRMLKWLGLPSLVFMDEIWHILLAYGLSFDLGRASAELWRQRGNIYNGRADLSPTLPQSQALSLISGVFVAPAISALLFFAAWYTGHQFDKSWGDVILMTLGSFTALRALADLYFIRDPAHEWNRGRAQLEALHRSVEPDRKVLRGPHSVPVNQLKEAAVQKIFTPLAVAVTEFEKNPSKKRYDALRKNYKVLVQFTGAEYKPQQIPHFLAREKVSFRKRLVYDRQFSSQGSSLKSTQGILPDRTDIARYTEKADGQLKVGPIEKIFPKDSDRMWAGLLKHEIRKRLSDVRRLLVEGNSRDLIATLAYLSQYLRDYQVTVEKIQPAQERPQRKEPVLAILDRRTEQCEREAAVFIQTAHEARPLLSSITVLLRTASKSKQHTKFANLGALRAIPIERLIKRWEALEADLIDWRRPGQSAGVKALRAGPLIDSMADFNRDLEYELIGLETSAAGQKNVSLGVSGRWDRWEDFQLSIHQIRLLTALQPQMIQADLRDWIQCNIPSLTGNILVAFDPSTPPGPVWRLFNEAQMYHLLLQLFRPMRFRMKNLLLAVEPLSDTEVQLVVSSPDFGMELQDLQPLRETVRALQGQLHEQGLPVAALSITLPLEAVPPPLVPMPEPARDRGPEAEVVVTPVEPRPVAEPEAAPTAAPAPAAALPRPVRTPGDLRILFDRTMADFMKDPAGAQVLASGWALKLADILLSEEAKSDELIKAWNKIIRDQGTFSKRIVFSRSPASSAISVLPDSQALRDRVETQVHSEGDRLFYTALDKDEWVLALQARIVQLIVRVRDNLAFSSQGPPRAELLADLIGTLGPYQAGMRALKAEHGPEAVTSIASGKGQILLIKESFDPVHDRLDHWLQQGIDQMGYHVVAVPDSLAAQRRLELGRFKAIVVDLPGPVPVFPEISSLYPGLPVVYKRDKSTIGSLLGVLTSAILGKLPKEVPVPVLVPWRSRLEHSFKEWENESLVPPAADFAGPFVRAGERVDTALARTDVGYAEKRSWEARRALLVAFTDFVQALPSSALQSHRVPKRHKEIGEDVFNVHVTRDSGSFDVEARFHQRFGMSRLVLTFTQTTDAERPSLEPMGYIGQISMEAGAGDKSTPVLTITTHRYPKKPYQQALLDQQPLGAVDAPWFEHFLDSWMRLLDHSSVRTTEEDARKRESMIRIWLGSLALAVLMRWVMGDGADTAALAMAVPLFLKGFKGIHLYASPSPLAGYWGEPQSHQILQRILKEVTGDPSLLSLKQVKLTQHIRGYTYELYGREHYDSEINFLNGMVARVGYLFFIREDLVSRMNPELREELGPRLILVDAHSMILDTGMGPFSAAAIVPWLSEGMTDSHFIDLGAGDGSVALAASRRGAVTFDLVEKRPDSIELARRQLGLNGVDVQHQVRFVQGDLNQTESVARALAPARPRTVVNINIGRWSQYGGTTNATGLAIVDRIGAVWRVVVGGYVLNTRIHKADYVNDKQLVQKMGFVLDDPQEVIAQTSLVRSPMLWVATRPEPESSAEMYSMPLILPFAAAGFSLVVFGMLYLSAGLFKDRLNGFSWFRGLAPAVVDLSAWRRRLFPKYERRLINDYYEQTYRYSDYRLVDGRRLWVSSQAFRPHLREETAVLLGNALPENAAVLSVGVGSGVLEQAMRQKFPDKGLRFFGVDTSRSLAGRAIDRGVRAVAADGERLPFGPAAFDAVVIPESLGYMHRRRTLKEAFRVLKPGGHIYILSFAGREATHLSNESYRYDTPVQTAADMRVIGFAETSLIPLNASDKPAHYYLLQGVKPLENNSRPGRMFRAMASAA